MSPSLREVFFIRITGKKLEKAQMMGCHFYDSGKHPESKLRNILSFLFLRRWIPVKCNLYPCCFVHNGFPRGLFGKSMRLFAGLKADFQFEMCLNET